MHTAQAATHDTSSQSLLSRMPPVPTCASMHLLVAVKMKQFPIAVRVIAAVRSGSPVVPLELLPIDEVHAAHRAVPVLGLGQPHVATGQVSDVDLSPFPPILPQARVVGRGRAPYQDVTPDREPLELQQVAARALVAKHPTVVPVLIQLAPVAPHAPTS